MRAAYDVEEVRSAEGTLLARLPDGTLMQRAAAGLARTSATVLGRVYGSRVVLLVGAGDNGGDTLYAGERLARRGARVDALLLTPEKAHPGGLAALTRAGGRVTTDESVLDTADLVLDGIVGIGGSGGLRAEAAPLVARAESGPGHVVAVDVPSGVDGSTGEVSGAAVHAEVTVTFGAVKAGLLVAPGAWHAGSVVPVDIGLQPELPAPGVTALQAADVGRLLPVPGYEADKYSRGVLGVCAGSRAYPGAAVLAVGGALRAGAGMVRFAAAAHPVELVRQHWPEVVTTILPPGEGGGVLEAGRVQAWAVGPGLGQDDDARAVLDAVLAAEPPVLVDADGINVLADDRSALRLREGPTLLTPHAGELARLLDVDRADVEARRLAYARRAAEETGATVLLKGSTTLVATPEGHVRVNTTGTPWLGTAGSGDVLSGFAGALLAQGLQPLDAGSVAAWLHGQAARLAGDGDVGLRASDLLDAWPRAVAVVRP
ncbi:MAG: NAD(P)H-hydrate dehydratase [Actinomycetes bacterium]